jgi:hypothetical protein
MSKANLCVDTPTTAELLELACTVASVLGQLDDSRTFEDIVSGVSKVYGFTASKDPEAVYPAQEAERAVFALLMLFSMVSPAPTAAPNGFGTQSVFGSKITQKQGPQNERQMRRPLFSFLQTFEAVLDTPQEIPFATLSVRNITCSTLALDVAGRRLNIVWVNEPRLHLHFDKETKTLGVFGLPSFCGLNFVQSETMSLLDECGPTSLLDEYQLHEKDEKRASKGH